MFGLLKVLSGFCSARPPAPTGPFVTLPRAKGPRLRFLPPCAWQSLMFQNKLVKQYQERALMSWAWPNDDGFALGIKVKW